MYNELRVRVSLWRPTSFGATQRGGALEGATALSFSTCIVERFKRRARKM
jgi:hypothetical protein